MEVMIVQSGWEDEYSHDVVNTIPSQKIMEQIDAEEHVR